ncbi:hypothetical protein [Piscibacillus salipiscarius]|nr:hypothetical protein [Piscibacillus salipiscarius]
MKNTLFLVLFSIYLSACSSSVNEDVVPFQEQVNDTFDTDVYIPHLQDYSITSAIIETGPFGKHKDLIIEYSKQLGNKKDEEYIEKYEENMGSEVLYGIYGGEPLVFKLTFNDGKQSSSPSNTK